jgi:hypothetical protein
MAKFIGAVYAQLGVKTNPSTAYHPQTDGLTERANQEVITVLRHYCTEKPETWALWLPVVEFALNNRVNDTTSFSPFYLDYARHPAPLPDSLRSQTDNPMANDFVNEATRIRDLAKQHIEKSTERLNRAHPGETNWQKGTQVWLSTKNLVLEETRKKLMPRRVGPFTIKRKIGLAAYELELPNHWHIHPVFHESLLTLAVPSPEHPSRPEPIEIDDQQEYEVDFIRAKQKKGRGVQYLV